MSAAIVFLMGLAPVVITGKLNASLFGKMIPLLVAGSGSIFKALGEDLWISKALQDVVAL